MTTLKFTLMAVATLAANITFANDGHVKNWEYKAEKNWFYPQLSCMDKALLQVGAATNIAYSTMLECGVAPACTQQYNNTINQAYGFIENQYIECIGGGNALTDSIFSQKER